MTARELRQKYLEFFQSKGHTAFPSGSLIPYDVTGRLDESLLFNGAGMVQFKPYFRGVANPPNPRLTTAQKCVRTGDIEEVGNLSHLTFFEMLGNFSFGEYFKEEAIALSWEFLTSKEWLGLDPTRLSFTVFEEDDEAYNCWAKHLSAAGIDPETRVFRLGEETNYWPAGAFSNGPPGPCGPNSEMFYWTSKTLEPPPNTRSSNNANPSLSLDGRGSVNEVNSGEGDILNAEKPSPELVPRTSSPIKGEEGGYSREQWIADDAAKNWLEIWNDVFIQYEWQGELKNPERPADGFKKLGMPNLPFQSIDTGMGLERTSAVLGGFQSVYDTDLFQPILSKIVGIDRTNRTDRTNSTSESYNSNPSYKSYQNLTESEARAARIIADHIRTACFCIADGILPGNSGRGYVLRRLIRRAVLKGARTLGFEDLFLFKVYHGVVEAMGDHYTELVERRDVIVETLKNEEALFRRTLIRGMELLEEELSHFGPGEKILRGGLAFGLYDTYGFPLEVTQELCEEAGVAVDVDGYEAALKEAQERSRAGSAMDSVYGGVGIQFTFTIESGQKGPTPTHFVGYNSTSCEARIVGVMQVPNNEALHPLTPSSQGRKGDSESHNPQSTIHNREFAIALDQTPFYAESGGQVSDIGVIRGTGFILSVVDVTKQDGVFVHICREVGDKDDRGELGERGDSGDRNPQSTTHDPQSDAPHTPNPTPYTLPHFGDIVIAEVDPERRRAITRNHTATHLLHAALRKVLGNHVTQAGSLVEPSHLRFDFTHGKAMTPDEIKTVEQMVNAGSLASFDVNIFADVPIAKAKEMGAMALFGEKYGDNVRVVDIRSMQNEPISTELCGGVHVRNTGEIGMFKILHEASAASGIRRIEAVTGTKAYEWAIHQHELVRQAADKLKSNPHDLLLAVDKTVDALKDERKKNEKLRASSAQPATTKNIEIGTIELVIQKAENSDPREATMIADRLAENQPRRITIVATISDNKATFICKVGAEAVSAGAHAGNLVKSLAQMVGGGGGGRPDFATAGGKDADKLQQALDAAPEIVKEQVKV
jgi:alanyl-tRNA synthetase